MAKKKKIMHLIASNFFGGPEKQIVEHLKLLNHEKFSGVFASFVEGESNEVLERASKSGLKTCSIVVSSALDFKAQRKLNRIIQKDEINLLCTHGYKACAMGWLAAMKNQVPLISFSRGYTSENIKVKIYEWIEQRVLIRATGIVAVSFGQENKLRNMGIVGKKNWVVHNAVNTVENFIVPDSEKRKIFSEFDIPIDALLVVTAGRLSPEKGHRYLVEAIANCKLVNKKIFFVFCGDGQCMDELKKQCRQIGILSYCRFPGFRKDLQNIFRVMDFFVLPSLTEGLPNVVLESFACAKPVVATQVGGIPELVKDGINGFLVPAQNSEKLANAMLYLINNKNRLRQMGMAGFDTVKKDFTFVEQTRKLETIYSEVLDSKVVI